MTTVLDENLTNCPNLNGTLTSTGQTQKAVEIIKYHKFTVLNSDDEQVTNAK